MNDNQEIALRLTREQFNTVCAHLQVGRWMDVSETVDAILKQAAPQLAELAKSDAALCAVLEESAASRIN